MDRTRDAYCEMMTKCYDQGLAHKKQAEVAKDELNALQEAVTALSKQKADLEARVRVAEQKAIDHAVRAREAELRAESAVESAAESATTKIAKHAVRAREAEMKYEAVRQDLEAVRAYQIASGYGPTPDTNRPSSGTGKADTCNGTVSSREATSEEVCTRYHSNAVGNLILYGRTFHCFLHLKELMGVSLCRIWVQPSSGTWVRPSLATLVPSCP